MADISKIKIPDGTSLNIKDATARQAIENLPKPMVFKGSLGTGGTITSLPTASSSNTGYVYKVIKAGTYASQSAKIGDTFVSDGSSWVLIPSGDEPSGTVTSIKINATSPINIDNSAAITTSGTRTISHASSGVSSGTYKSVTVNSTGHVTAGTNPTTIDGYGITDSAGRIVTGKEYTIDSEIVIADTGAEVFNRYNGTYQNIATGEYSHAEGQNTRALADYSHAEGNTTIATGASSHAEGAGSRANSGGSHAEGLWTIASSENQHVQGKYNIEDSNNTYSFIIGNGKNVDNRSNAFAIDWQGKIYTNNASIGVDVNELAKNVKPIPKLIDDGAKNLLKITGTSQTINGVTFTVNDDGAVTVNGTNTGTGSAAFIFIPNRQAILIPDGDYILSGCPQGGGNDTFDLRWFRYSSGASAYDTGSGAVVRKNGNTADSNIAIVVKAGKTVNNVVFKPMLCTVEDYAVSTDYVPYAPSNRELYEEVNTKVSIADIYGIKPTISNGTDLNTMQTPGAYACSGATIAASLLNCPTTTEAFIMYVDYIAATSRIIQRLYAMNTTTGASCVYIRALYSGGWGSWRKFDPGVPSFDTSTYTSLTAYVDTLNNGTYSFFVPNNNALPDVPMNNANAIVKITVYSAGAATMEFWPISSAVNGQLFTQIKSSGTWRGWYKFEGTAVADDTWITLKSGSGTGISASDVKYRLNGKTMCITGYVKPSSTAASITIGTLAEKYRPISLQTDHVSQASGIAETTFSAQVLTDGTVKFQGNSASAITANIQYYFTLTYIVAN